MSRLPIDFFKILEKKRESINMDDDAFIIDIGELVEEINNLNNTLKEIKGDDKNKY